MAEVFDISKHIKVEVLGERQGLLQTPYNIFTVNGKQYNPNDYDLAYIPSGPATELEPTRPTVFSASAEEDLHLFPFQTGSGRYYLSWKPQENVSSYEIYYLSSTTNGWKYLGVMPPERNWMQVILYTTADMPGRDYYFKIEVNTVGGGSYTLPYLAVPTGELNGDGYKDWRNRVEFSPTGPNGGILKFGGVFPSTNASVGYMSYELFESGITPHPGDRYLINIVPNETTYPDYSVPVTFVHDSPLSLDDLHIVMGVYEVPIGGLNLDTEAGYKFVVNFETADGMVYHVGTYVYGEEPPNEIVEEQVVAYGWWEIDCSVAEVQTETSYGIEKGLLKTPEPGTCTLILKGSEGNPITNTALALDSKIVVKLDAAASPDGTEDFIFSGYIESYSTNYDVYGNEITTIQCVDGLSKAMNVIVDEYDFSSEASFSQRVYDVFTTYIAPKTSSISYDVNTLWPLLEPYDSAVFPPEDGLTRTNVLSSEILTELTQGEYGVLAQNRGGVIFWFNRASGGLFYDPTLTALPQTFGFSTTHDPDSLDHHCITDFTIRNSLDDITNKVVASLTYDELTTSTYENAASIAKYGERAYEVELNLYAPSGNPTQYLDQWVSDLSYAEDQSELESVTTEVVNRKGFVTRAYQYDITFDPIRVFIQAGPVNINGVWFAKSIRHSITPENWIMELGLTAD